MAPPRADLPEGPSRAPNPQSACHADDKEPCRTVPCATVLTPTLTTMPPSSRDSPAFKRCIASWSRSPRPRRAVHEDFALRRTQSSDGLNHAHPLRSRRLCRGDQKVAAKRQHPGFFVATVAPEPVLSENSVEPSGRSVIVAQEPAEPRPAADRVGRSARRFGKNQLVVQALVIPFPVIVRSELAKRPA